MSRYVEFSEISQIFDFFGFTVEPVVYFSVVLTVILCFSSNMTVVAVSVFVETVRGTFETVRETFERDQVLKKN